MYCSEFPTVSLAICSALSYSNSNLTDHSAVLEKYYVPIFQVLLTKLNENKTEQLASRFVRFYHFFSSNDEKGLGADFFIKICDQIQSGYAVVHMGVVIESKG